MKLIADTHTHTTASTHAYSTLQEMVHEAALQGLFCIAITDHGRTMPGSPGKWYFHNMRVVPHLLENVLVLRGQETNILDSEGNTDISEQDREDLDWIVASIHDICFQDKNRSKEAITNTWLKIAVDPSVNVIGHSGTEGFQYDYDRVLPEFARNGKLVELNEGTFLSRKDSVHNCIEIMKHCKQYGVPIILNSDAHFSTQVGRFDQSVRLLKEIEFPQELIVNADLDRFQEYLKRYTRVYEDPIFH